MKGLVIMQKRRMTWDEIKQEYPEKWVVLDEVDWDLQGHYAINSAIVIKVCDKPATEDYLNAAHSKYPLRYVETGQVFHVDYVTV